MNNHPNNSNAGYHPNSSTNSHHHHPNNSNADYHPDNSIHPDLSPNQLPMAIMMAKQEQTPAGGASSTSTNIGTSQNLETSIGVFFGIFF